MNIKNAIAGVFLMASLGVNAHDFTATVNGQRLYFDITNQAKRTVAVTYNGSIAEKKVNSITGIIEIPSKVQHNNVVYNVTAINPKAFAGAKRLKGIVLPPNVEAIGDFAFERCDSLASIVFPGNPITLGQGVFYGCRSISDVSFGSDWDYIDFTMFRWSDNLTNISIPAKVKKVHGVKKLKNLAVIVVDPNNTTFASYDGMLYSKDGKTLYACPRAYNRPVKIYEGTEMITSGALIDCREVTYVDFPASLKSLSFRETSRMKNLETIVMRPSVPIVTAYNGGQPRFMLQVANEKVSIVTLSSSKDAYEAMLISEAGEYSESNSGVPYMVTVQQIPTKKNLKVVKNFDKY